ncbi:uncharacterized protein LOC129964111 [Argiope bruennichi]|uniref:uncharacterized protein LOC129964111 n=1 Tax=Argiope bruennichi TaxID=94029 RepID=UPI002494AE23|nr:uncharacterized protein LOC129964111 [Argiope bruennichi]
MEWMVEIDFKTEDGVLKQKKSLKNYTSMVLRESSLTAVSNIISTENTYRKAFKIFVLLFCFSGFFYQSYTLLYHIFQYPTIVDIRIENPKTINMPGITFCNNNGINRKKFCATFPERCYEADKDFCRKHRSYCGKNETTMVPKEEYYELLDNLTLKDLQDIGENAEDLLLQQRNFEEEEVLGPFIRAKSLGGSGRMACYSMFTVIDSYKEPQTTDIQKMIEIPALIMIFNVREDEQFIPGHRTGLFLAIHSPYEGYNPTEKGIFMKPGKTYKLYVTTEKELLLPYPYETDCLDYNEMWENNNRSGPRLQEMCQHKCLLDATSKYLNCTAPFALYPSDLRICGSDEIFHEKTFEDFGECAENCKDDCAKTKYSVNVQERYTSDFFWNEAPDEEETKLIIVEIIIDHSEVITFLHRPQYLSVETFSYIGGFIGVWLGISLIEVTDFVESIFRIFRYAIKKRNI